VSELERKHAVKVLENRNRLKNIRNRKQAAKEELWGQFKRACREQTVSTKTEKGSAAPKAQSSEEGVAPKKTRLTFGVRMRAGVAWQKNPKPGTLAKELKQLQAERRRHEMLVPIVLTSLTTGKTRGVKALLDNGCTRTCIDWGYAKAEGFEMTELDVPITANNADGTENAHGKITHYVELQMGIGSHQERIKFLVTSLGKARIFIGMDWLLKHNPEIDWRTQKIVFSRCPPECNMEGQESETYAEEPQLEEGESLLLVDFGAAIDLRLKETHSQKLAEAALQDKTEKNVQEKVPVQYHDYLDVFAKKSFDALPEKRPWDHAIELKPDVKAVDCKIYPLSRLEQEKLDEFLEENLQSGRIRPSKSPMASAFFFVKKKDGTLRPVQDYRKLNDMTVKNRYPLPLISELVSKLRGAHFFTKLDIRWGYNNVRIQEGDEWKAAFRTNRGLFEPLVMFFGLTNSPATFQTMMNDILRELINEGHVIVYLDDILIFTDTLEKHREVVNRVLELLAKHKLFLKPEKCEFEKTEMEYWVLSSLITL
jgi:hypothetical protein